MTPVTLIQLSDPHIVTRGQLAMGRVDTAALLRMAVQTVQRLQPAPLAVLLSGDLVDRGTSEEYEHLRELLAPLPAPVYLLPGNHDDAATLRAAFPEHAYLQPPATEPGPAAEAVLYAVDLGSLRLVGVDSTVPRRSHGRLDAERLAWLDRTLAQVPGQPTLVALHHPPFDTGLAAMDAMSLREGREGLAEVIARHPQVQRVLCGHVHRACVRRWAGTLVATAPSTAHQIPLDQRADAELTWSLEPPGFLVHSLIGGELVTQVQVSSPPLEAQAFE
ncbi:MAG: phosphodiesterase [Rubrivivax sp.]|nr:phosphodiesterase [Rubrivivax sp.]